MNYLGQSAGGNCLGSNYVEVNYPGAIIPAPIVRGQFFWVSLFRGQLPGGQLSGGAIVLEPKNVSLLSVLKILKWNVYWNVLRTLHNPKKQPPRNIRIAVLKNSRKFPRVLFFAIKSTPLRVISWGFSRIFQNSCFKEHIRTAASEIIWGNRRDDFLFHRCCRPEILE